MHHGYETCSQSFLSKVAESIFTSRAVYDSDVDMQLRSYEYSMQWGAQYIFASLDHSLEDRFPDDAPASRQ